MRKVRSAVLAALLVVSIAAPAQGATTKAGDKCTTKFTVAKVGTIRLYCAPNNNAKTKKLYKLAWRQSTSCYNMIVANNDLQAKFKASLTSVAEFKTKIASIRADLSKVDQSYVADLQTTLNGLQAQVDGLDATLAVLAPSAKQSTEGIQMLCS